MFDILNAVDYHSLLLNLLISFFHDKGTDHWALESFAAAAKYPSAQIGLQVPYPFLLLFSAVLFFFWVHAFATKHHGTCCLLVGQYSAPYNC